MIGASGSCADVIVRGHDQEYGGVLVQLDGLVDIELMLVSLLLVEAQVLEEELEGGKEGVLER